MEYDGSDIEFEELAIRQEMVLPARYSAVVLPPRAMVADGHAGRHQSGAMLVMECEDADGAPLLMRQPV